MATMASFHNKLMNLEARLSAENEARSRDRLPRDLTRIPRDLTTGFTSPQHTPRPRLKTRKFSNVNYIFLFTKILFMVIMKIVFTP